MLPVCIEKEKSNIEVYVKVSNFQNTEKRTTKETENRKQRRDR